MLNSTPINEIVESHQILHEFHFTIYPNLITPHHISRDQ